MVNKLQIDDREVPLSVVDSLKKKVLTYKLLSVSILLIGIVLGYLIYSYTGFDYRCYLALKNQKFCNTQQLKWDENNKLSSIIPTPTPMPFADLTIPYLRAQKYEGRMGEKTLIGEFGSYNSYLASYSSGGLKINGLLTIPNENGDVVKPQDGWPAIVFVHGYIPPSLYQTQEKYVQYVDSLARSGFAVFKIDLRGHGQSEGEPSGAYYSSDYIVDVLNAVNALQNENFIDPKAVGLWGHSMAGNILLRAHAVRPEIPAVVMWAGAGYSYEDIQKYGIQDNSYRPPVNNENRQRRRDQLFKEKGQFSKTSPFWRQVAATNYLSDIKGAIQLHHAIDDDVVNVGYSRDLDSLLDKTSIPHEFYEYPYGGHNILDPEYNAAMQNTINFFKKYL